MKKILAILLAGMMTATALVGRGGGDASSKTDNGSKADNGSSDGASLRLKAQSLTTATSAMKVQTASL